MKEQKTYSKKIAIFMIMASIVPIFNTSPVLAGSQEPYEEVFYDTDIVSDSDWENTDIGEYPIDTDSQEWSALASVEAVAACDMPKEYAESLTTEELVDYAANYPFLMDVLAFDRFEDGFEHLEEKSGVFEELFSRPDAAEELINEYKKLNVDYEVVAAGNSLSTDYDAHMFIEEYVGLNYDSLSESEVSEFVGTYGENYEKMNDTLEDSAFVTVFYDAVEEAVGEVPENAIPDSVAGDVIATSDTGGASFTKISSGTCSVCGQKQNYGTITVKSKKVCAYKWVSGGYSDLDISIMDEYIAKYYPSFTKVRSATGKYNCHSYAWYSASSKNKYWINNPASIYGNAKYWKLWKAPMRSLKSGDRITFWKDGNILHSAVVKSSKKCASKLGHFGVYKTTISEMKSFYGSTSTKSYIPAS